MNSRPTLTIAQVIEQFNLSRATVRRGIESGRFQGAKKDSQGRWTVPVEALVAEGIKARKTWLNEIAGEQAHERTQGIQSTLNPFTHNLATEHGHTQVEHAHELTQRAMRIAQLEAELTAEKRLREASERNAEDLRNALRMIESRSPNEISVPPEVPRRKWWSRQPQTQTKK